MKEALVWVGRALALLPEFIGLWKAAETNDPNAELEAQLALTRAIKDRQAREEIPGG